MFLGMHIGSSSSLEAISSTYFTGSTLYFCSAIWSTYCGTFSSLEAIIFNHLWNLPNGYEAANIRYCVDFKYMYPFEPILTFSLGLATTLALLGVGTSFAGKAYGQIRQGLPLVSSGLAVLMGLNLWSGDGGDSPMSSISPYATGF